MIFTFVGTLFLAIGAAIAVVAFTHDDTFLSDYGTQSVWAIVIGLVLMGIGYLRR